MAKWFSNSGEGEEDAGKAVEAKFSSIESTAKEAKEISEKNQSTLESLAESIRQMNERAANEDKARQEAQAKERAKAAPVSKTAEEQFEEFAADPTAFVNSRVSPTTKVAIMAVARQTRQDVLGSKEYYHGDFKKKVDALIESTTDIQQTTNPVYIENCYKVVLGDNMEKIISGEIKKNMALHGSADGSQSGERGVSDGKATVEYRDKKTSFAASQMGLTDEDIISAAKDQAIHGLELVG